MSPVHQDIIRLEKLPDQGMNNVLLFGDLVPQILPGKQYGSFFKTMPDSNIFGSMINNCFLILAILVFLLKFNAILTGDLACEFVKASGLEVKKLTGKSVIQTLGTEMRLNLNLNYNCRDLFYRSSKVPDPALNNHISPWTGNECETK